MVLKHLEKSKSARSANSSVNEEGLGELMYEGGKLMSFQLLFTRYFFSLFSLKRRNGACAGEEI